jgi:hypothetical protein
MSSKQEIKDLFTAELLLTPEYQIALKVKQAILYEIATPNIQGIVVYTYEQPIERQSVEVLKMCLLLLFGFNTNNISENCVVIEMKSFLE